MCGIVGYTGDKNAAPILLDGLSRLEYRGYDSAGIAVLDGGITIEKSKGRLSVLSEKTGQGEKLKGFTGIGHTRWATHGKPSDTNAHPHLSQSKKFAVVRNGIIENYLELRAFLEHEGFNFISDTDTEAIAHLFDFYYDQDIISTTTKVIKRLNGSFALGILCSDFENGFIAVKKDSPLCIGLGNSESFIASDMQALLPHTANFFLLDDNEIAVVQKNSIKIFDTEKNEIKKDTYNADQKAEAAEKNGFEHFMLKEIFEQPKAVKDTTDSYIKNNEINFGSILSEEYIKSIKRIYITACGSAYHVGVSAKYIIENLSKIPTDTMIASEFRYHMPALFEDSLVIVISQSGETADTLAAMREAKKRGAKILAVVNAAQSSISREADHVLYTLAGPEIAVATTKAYSTQLSIIYLIAVYIAKILNTIPSEKIAEITYALKKLPENIEKILESKEKIRNCAEKYSESKNVFFIGRGLDYAACLEGSLKLKEISYIHSEAYAAGELKHGAIALIEDKTLCIAVCTQQRLFKKMLSNIKEVKARGAEVIAITKEDNKEIETEADYVIYIPDSSELVLPIEAVIPLQLFSYYTALKKGLDIDKPRNLAKSVTVE